jgi:hypothetical protein
MNFNISDIANAFTLKAADSMASGIQKVSEKAAPTAQTVAEVAGKTEEVVKNVDDVARPAAAVTGLVDPMQLWTSLTQQFQTIAASAMAEAGKVTAMDVGKNPVKGVAKQAAKTVANVPVKKTPAKRAAAKTVAKKAATSAVAKAASPRRR